MTYCCRLHQHQVPVKGLAEEWEEDEMDEEEGRNEGGKERRVGCQKKGVDEGRDEEIEAEHEQNANSAYQQQEVDLAINKKWNSAVNYAQVLESGRNFLRGKADGTPWHGPLDEETTPLVPALLHLHDHGLLTVTSQPAGRSITKMAKRKGGVECREWHKRPYLEFFLPRAERKIPPEVVIAFCIALQMHPEIAVSIYGVFPKVQLFDTTINQGGEGPYHVVEKMRVAATEEQLEEAEWNVMATTAPFKSVNEVASEYGWLPGISALRKAELLSVHVSARSWEGDLDLLALVEKLAEESGLKVVYRGDAGEPGILAMVLTVVFPFLLWKTLWKLRGSL